MLEPLLARKFPLLVDEAYGALRFDGEPPLDVRALAPDRTYLIGSVAKSVCPGLRVGWLVR